MIISAAPGIGKSTLAKKYLNIIDLDISTFDVTSKTRIKDYCETAIYLSNQGYVVLTGTHKEVLEYFINKDLKDYFIIQFDFCLKQYLLNKLYMRYEESPTLKHLHAYNGIKKYFDEIVSYIKMLDKNKYYLIENPDYNIEQIVNQIINKEPE